MIDLGDMGRMTEVYPAGPGSGLSISIWFMWRTFSGSLSSKGPAVGVRSPLRIIVCLCASFVVPEVLVIRDVSLTAPDRYRRVVLTSVAPDVYYL